MSILDALVESGLETSKGDAKKSISAGAIYLNEVKVEDGGSMVNGSSAVNGCLLLRKGKKSFRVLKKA